MVPHRERELRMKSLPSELDLVLLHPPSVYDFRQETILYGPIADFISAPLALDTVPLGYSSLADCLGRAGYRVSFLNLASRMLHDPHFDAEAAIAALTPLAFAIDFHWLSHAQGTLAVAQIVKTFHPETPVILGGFAATYYHRELMDYPQIDYVLRGDSTEEPLLHLVECLSLGRVPDLVPGLTWRTRSGHVVENPLGVPLASLDDPAFAQRRSTCGDGGWSFPCQMSYPALALRQARAAVGLMVRGCTQNCLICGGSAYAYQRLHGRHKPAYRSPERLARDLNEIRRYHSDLVYIPGDITQAGMDYADRFLRAMRGFPNLVCLDLFQPVPRNFLQDIADALPHFALQISMDSHDRQVRQAIGKSYSNLSIEQTIADALSLGCEYLDLHFTIGLPYQDYDSVMATVAYCDDLLTRFGEGHPRGNGGRLQPFIAPLAPFLDPGSIAFEEPGRSGYRLFFQSLEEHRQALLAPSWKYVLNYETEWMTRDAIARATYDATVAMARLRARHGLVPVDHVQELENYVGQARRLLAEIDRVLATGDTDRLQDMLRALKSEIDEVNRAGLWSEHFVPPLIGPLRGRERYALRGVGLGQRRAWSPPRVWGLFKDWWRRRSAPPRDRNIGDGRHGPASPRE